MKYDDDDALLANKMARDQIRIIDWNHKKERCVKRSAFVRLICGMEME